MHGTAVLDQLKGDARTADIPVIVISAWAEATTADLARERGAYEVLRKPFDVGELIALVERALSPRASATEA